MRYLKGHGIDYALDAATWAHYRRERLNKMQLFKVRLTGVGAFQCLGALAVLGGTWQRLEAQGNVASHLPVAPQGWGGLQGAPCGAACHSGASAHALIHAQTSQTTHTLPPKVLRHFVDDAVKLQAAADHLIAIGFLSRRDVLRAGGVNLLWGLLLQARGVGCSRARGLALAEG